MQLQRDYGNRYVQRLVQHISRKRTEAIQNKLAVGPAGDKYEQEADQVAKQVVARISSPGQGTAQRQLQKEENLQMKPLAQRQVGLEGGDVEPEVEQTIQQQQGRGQALPESLRSSMEGAFGADFSGVRVHNDSEADALNDSMQARAFTIGQDIYLRQGEYNPGNSAGQELLAHELTHVVQQSSGNAKRGQSNRSVPSHPNPSEVQRGVDEHASVTEFRADLNPHHRDGRQLCRTFDPG